MTASQAKVITLNNHNYSEESLQFVYRCIEREAVKGNFEAHVFLPNYFLRQRLIRDGFSLFQVEEDSNRSIDNYKISWL